MILDYASNDHCIYNGTKFILSQFIVHSSNLGVNPSLISKIDTDRKLLYFWTPEDGDLTSDYYQTGALTGSGLTPRCALIEINGKSLVSCLPYKEIEIALYCGWNSPFDVYKETVEPIINEDLKEAYKEVILEKLCTNEEQSLQKPYNSMEII